MFCFRTGMTHPPTSRNCEGNPQNSLTLLHFSPPPPRESLFPERISLLFCTHWESERCWKDKVIFPVFCFCTTKRKNFHEISIVLAPISVPIIASIPAITIASRVHDLSRPFRDRTWWNYGATKHAHLTLWESHAHHRKGCWAVSEQSQGKPPEITEPTPREHCGQLNDVIRPTGLFKNKSYDGADRRVRDRVRVRFGMANIENMAGRLAVVFPPRRVSGWGACAPLPALRCHVLPGVSMKSTKECCEGREAAASPLTSDVWGNLRGSRWKWIFLSQGYVTV